MTEGLIAAHIFTGTLFLVHAAGCCLMLFRFLKRRSSHAVTPPEAPVSVIICSRNNADLLEKNLPSVLQQSYHEFEVIVVDDQSSDHTAEVLQKLGTQHPHLKTLRIAGKQHPGKKHALTEGVRNASHSWLLLTDSDCRPAGNSWISAMMRGRQEGAQLMLGYGAYEKAPGLLNKLIRFDTAVIAEQYMSFALYGHPYMGVGRNMAYRKELFDSAGGLQAHWSIASGDDDLFVQAAANGNNTSVVTGEEAFTYSEPKKDLASWIRQKARHISASAHYRLRFKILLAVLPLTGFLFYVSVAAMALHNAPSALGWLAARWLTAYIFHAPFLAKFHEKDLIPYVPVLDLISIFVLPVPGLVNLFTGNRKWN